VAFSSDSRTLAAGGEDAAIHRWDTSTGKELPPLPTGERNWPQSLVFSPDSVLLAMAGLKAIRLWEMSTGKERVPIPVPGGPGHVAFSSDGKSLVSGGDDKVIRLWELASGKPRWQAKGHEQAIFSVAISADGKTILSGGWDQTVRLWDAVTGKELHCFRGHKGAVRGVALSPDGRRAASASEDHTALIWDLMGHAPPRRQRVLKISLPELDDLWNRLAADDAAVAYQALCALAAAHGQSVPFLKERMRLHISVVPERMARLIRDLDSDDFEVRERATHELEEIGEPATLALRQARAAVSSPEARHRLTRVLVSMEGWSSERLRTLRALEVLEHIGSPQARRVLEEAARWAPQTRLSREASAALRRLDARR
jgi:hypothetical protein